MTLEKNNISASFLEKYRITLTAQELLWGMDRDFIRPKAIIEYSVTQLANLCEKDILYDIALLNDKEEQYKVREILEAKLLNFSSSWNQVCSEVELVEKWSYLLLKSLYDNKTSFDDPWGIIEVIYSDLNYPEEIGNLVRYMPMKDYEQNDLSPMETLMHRWEAFLKEKDRKFISAN